MKWNQRRTSSEQEAREDKLIRVQVRPAFCIVAVGNRRHSLCDGLLADTALRLAIITSLRPNNKLFYQCYLCRDNILCQPCSPCFPGRCFSTKYAANFLTSSYWNDTHQSGITYFFHKCKTWPHKLLICLCCVQWWNVTKYTYSCTVLKYRFE